MRHVRVVHYIYSGSELYGTFKRRVGRVDASARKWRNLSYGFVSEIRDWNPGPARNQVKLSVTTPSIALFMSAVLSALLHKRYTHAYSLESPNCPRRSTRASVVRWNSEAGSTVVHSAGAIWRLPARRNSACNKEAVLLLWNYHYENVKVFIDRPVGLADIKERLRGS